ncbi:quinolinate synthase NadA [Acanthopleuribacter pedis]|uniref:Quinolinate synthase n=1 Tax=Acanthopleuribacter pedis TaxID=442870 RepID=A0A8J7QID3_9BACT|nr:quinolinate synthase NadA [Acanthopleuribacter pedis]MBO1321266.1 quinolinate synthase NadA [Acanthopleuribacter pedis]
MTVSVATGSTPRIDPGLDLFEEIERLKKETDTILLAHYYQEGDIQDIADFIGDSLDLARRAQAVTHKRILFAGVHFMAETAKILNPSKTVLIPDMAAGCSLADSCPPDAFAAFKAKHPDHLVVSYINCTAEIKALSDIICTSTNAVDIVNSIPAEQPIIFAPDRFLGAWVQKKAQRDLVLWQGSCIVHENFSHKKLIELKVAHPAAKVVAHPECPPDILDEADFIGSTRKILNFVSDDACDTFIVVTEAGIIHQMKKNEPEKTFIPALNDDETCSCNECPFMKLNTMEKVYLALRDGAPEIHMEESLRARAELPLLEMLKRSK